LFEIREIIAGGTAELTLNAEAAVKIVTWGTCTPNIAVMPRPSSQICRE
jgi:hypothetical protein